MTKQQNSLYPHVRTKLVFYAKLAVTTTLLLWLLSQIQFQEIKLLLENSKIIYLFFSLLIHFIAFILFSYRWWTLLIVRAPACRYRQTIGSYYIGLFFNNFLPTSIGGDIVRIIRMRKMGFELQQLVESTIADRIVGLYSIVTIGVVALLFTSKSLLEIESIFLLGSCLLLVPIALFVFSSRSFYSLMNNIFKNHESNFYKLVTTTHTSLTIYRNNPSAILISFILSAFAQFLIVYSYIFIGLSLNVPLADYNYFIIIPIVFLATGLPISIGGIGVREGVLVGLFSMYSVDTQSAISVSICYIFILLISTLPGCILLFRKT